MKYLLSFLSTYFEKNVQSLYIIFLEDQSTFSTVGRTLLAKPKYVCTKYNYFFLDLGVLIIIKITLNVD